MSDLFTHAPDDVGDALIRLNQRLGEVETTLTDPGAHVGAVPTKLPDGVTVGETIELTEHVHPPIITSAEGRAHLHDFHGYIQWDLNCHHATETEIEWVIVVAPGIYDEPSYIRTASTSLQIMGLRAQTTYAVRGYNLNSVGKRSAPSAWVEFTTPNDTTIPDILTGLALYRGATTLIAKVNPSTDFDVAGGLGLYQFQADTVDTFDSPDLRDLKSTSYIVAWNDVYEEADWYGRARAIDMYGNEGPWSAVVGPATAGGVVDSMVVAGLNAAKITFGVMDGDRINANTLNANRIKTSSLTSADITLSGGSLRAGSPPTTGLLINSQGLRLYNGGVQTVVLDAVAGTATFAGHISGGTINIGSNFAVDASGNLVASNVTLSGNITATSGTFTGTVNATAGNFSGNITVSGTATVTGTIRTATSGGRIEISGSETQVIRMYSGLGEAQSPAVGVSTVGGASRIGIYAANAASFVECWSNGSLVLSGTINSTLSAGGFSTAGTISGNTLSIGAGGATINGALSSNSLTTGNIVMGTSNTLNTRNITSGGTINMQSGNFTFGTEGQLSVGGSITTATPTTSLVPNMQITSGGLIRTTSHANSSLRYKENIRPLSTPLEGLLKLNVVEFDFKAGIHDEDSDRYNHVGLIAEEVARHFPLLVNYDEEGRPDTVDYYKLSIYFIPILKKLVDKVGLD